jgi:hypothetical protein
MVLREGAMEGVGLTNPSQSFWESKSVFVTGHTGFKGGLNRYRFPRHEPASQKTASRTVPEKGHCCGHDAG